MMREESVRKGRGASLERTKMQRILVSRAFPRHPHKQEARTLRVWNRDHSGAEMPEDALDKSIVFQSDSSRRRILLSYWAAILIGIPLWWVTTSLTRLPLPESRVKGLEPRQVSSYQASYESDLTNVSTAKILPGCIDRRRCEPGKRC